MIKIFHDAAFLRSSLVSCFDEVTYFERGINTESFLSSIVRNHEVSLERYDSNSLLSFAGQFSFFSSCFCRCRKIVRNSFVKESTTRVYKFDCTTNDTSQYGLTKWKAKSEKPLQSLPFFSPSHPTQIMTALQPSRRKPKREESKGKKGLTKRH